MFSYCVIFKVRVTVWVETAVPEVPVAVTVTWEVLEVPVPFDTVLLIPQPDTPAAKAQVQRISRQSPHEHCIFPSFRLRRMTANPDRPPGHQKARAKSIGLTGR
jgi:hypothetical protein